MNALFFCCCAWPSQSPGTSSMDPRTTNAEEEPLEIGGHLEEGAVRYFLVRRERRRRRWLSGTMQ